MLHGSQKHSAHTKAQRFEWTDNFLGKGAKFSGGPNFLAPVIIYSTSTQTYIYFEARLEL